MRQDAETLTGTVWASDEAESRMCIRVGRLLRKGHFGRDPPVVE